MKRRMSSCSSLRHDYACLLPSLPLVVLHTPSYHMSPPSRPSRAQPAPLSLSLPPAPHHASSRPSRLMSPAQACVWNGSVRPALLKRMGRVRLHGEGEKGGGRAGSSGEGEVGAVQWAGGACVVPEDGRNVRQCKKGGRCAVSLPPILVPRARKRVYGAEFTVGSANARRCACGGANNEKRECGGGGEVGCRRGVCALACYSNNRNRCEHDVYAANTGVEARPRWSAKALIMASSRRQ